VCRIKGGNRFDFRQIEYLVKSGKRLLVLNADDMGMSTGVTDGIARTYEEGLVTDISLIVSMPDSERAARIAREGGYSVGVHLDLTRQKRDRKVGRPLMGGEVPSLIDEEGFFHGSGEFRKRMLAGKVNLEEIRSEIRSQVQRALDWGLELTHIDSNEGMHNYYPEILRMVVEIAKEKDLPVRWPNPVHLDWLRREGILTTDHLNYNFYEVPPEDKRGTFLRLLGELEPGITEFIFHPANPDEETRSLTAWDRREAELELLLDGSFQDTMRELGIEPISFGHIRDRQRDMRERGVGLLKAGTARVKITPPFPTQMGGYFDRLELSRGKHEDLHARALFLDDGTRQVLLISVEVLYVDSKMVGEVRRRISESTGLGEECIMVFATHTHSGPEGHTEIARFLGFFPNPTLRKFLVERIACCALMAFNGSRRARLGSGSSIAGEMSTNRQRAGGPTDSELGVMRVEDLYGEVIGALVNFTAHPVILNSENLLYSPEYPGHAMSILEEVLGQEAVCLFANGACGNVTIRRRKSSFSEVCRVGEILAGHGLQTMGGIDTSEEVSIGAACSSMPLNFRGLPTLVDARREVEELRSEIAKSGGGDANLAKKLKKAMGTMALAEKSSYIRSFLGDDLTTQLQVLRVNDDFLLGVPAELFVEYGLRLKKELEPRRTFLIGYCNDIVGYVVTPEASEEGGYEAGSTLLDDQAGTRIVDGLMSMVDTRTADE